MKKIIKSPLFWISLFILYLFRDFILHGKIPIAIDTLIGAYLPWLDYKWGFPVGVPVKNPAAADGFATFFVWKKLMADFYHAGVIPLWNRFAFSGTPMLATFHSSVLSPANVFFLLPFNIGWSLYILAGCLAAAFSMYFFLRNKIKNPAAILVGSLIYATAGLMTTWAQYGTAVWAAAILPLIFLSVEKIIDNKSRLYYPFVSFLIAFLAFSGHVQLFTYTAVLAPLYYFYLVKTKKVKINPKQIIQLGLFVVLGLGLAAPQLFPSFEFFRRSIRGEESYASGFNFGLSNFIDIIRLWAADFFGNPATGNHFGKVDYNEFSSYLGVLTLPLITGYLLSRPKKKPVFFIVLFFVTLILAYNHPLSRLIFSLPLPLLTYSSASRVFFLTSLAAAVLTATGLDHLLTEKSALTKTRMTAALLIAVTLLALLLIHPPYQQISIRNALFYVGLLGAFIFITFLLKNKLRYLVIGIALIFAFDLSRYYLKYNTFVPPNLVFPTTPVIDFLQKQPGTFRIAKENTNLLPANSWIAYHLESVEGYDPLTGSDYAHFFHKISGGSYNDTISRIETLEKIDPRYYDAMNIKYVLAKSSKFAEELGKYNYAPVFTSGSVAIFENRDVKERAFFVSKLSTVNAKNQVAAQLDNPGFDPRTEALVLGEALTIEPGKNTVTSIDESDLKVTIKTKNESVGFLVLTDAYDPGWQVKINGQKSKIYETDGALRGVLVPKGDNVIVFEYRPLSWTLGIIIFFSSLLILIFVSLGLHLTKRHD